MDLDALEQRASDNYGRRLTAFLEAIRIAADAAKMGDGAMERAAYHLHYKKTTLRRMAKMVDLPPEAISLDTLIGAYWEAIKNDATVEQVCAAVEAGVETPAQMKAFLGIEAKEREPVCIECPACGARFER